MKSQIPADASSAITLTMDAQQLDMLMLIFEGCWFGGDVEEKRSIEGIREQVEIGVREWKPGVFDNFESDIILLAPVYRQMLDAWRPLGMEPNTGNEFKTVFEFMERVRAARAAVGSAEAEVCHA